MVIVLLFMANLLIGSVPIPVSDVFSILMGHEGEKASWSFIVWESRLPQALTALLCGGALAVCGLIFALICQYFAAKCAYGFGTQLRNALYHHINTLSHRELDHLGTASLITRLNTDSNTLQSGVNMFIRLGTRAPFLIIGAAVMSIRIDLKLSLIFFIVVPLISYILYRVMHYTIPHYESNQGQLDVVARRTRENLDGVRVIRAFSRQKQESQAYAQACGELSEQVIAVGRVSALLNPISFLIMNLLVWRLSSSHRLSDTGRSDRIRQLYDADCIGTGAGSRIDGKFNQGGGFCQAYFQSVGDSAGFGWRNRYLAAGSQYGCGGI